jgi:hypothetical protein
MVNRTRGGGKSQFALDTSCLCKVDGFFYSFVFDEIVPCDKRYDHAFQR